MNKQIILFLQHQKIPHNHKGVPTSTPKVCVDYYFLDCDAVYFTKQLQNFLE